MCIAIEEIWTKQEQYGKMGGIYNLLDEQATSPDMGQNEKNTEKQEILLCFTK